MGEVARIDPVDVVVAVSARAIGVASGVSRRTGSALRPVAGGMLRPGWVPGRLQPGRWLAAASREGEARRAAVGGELSRRLDVLVPVVLDEALRRGHLTDLVLRHVDLDRVVAAVDLDAAAARLDVSSVLDRIDLTAVVLERVDLGSLIEAVLDRMDLTSVVLRRVDLDRVVATVDLDAAAARLDVPSVLDRLDLTAVVLERVDLGALVEAVLDRMDLTSVVLRRVDLDALIQAVLDRIDLTSVVLRRVDLDALIQAILDRIDLVPLAAEVIDGVDLPEIIRESTGSMASDTVQGVRMQGIVADEAVGRAIDRLLLRRSRRATRAPSAARELAPGERTPGPASEELPPGEHVSGRASRPAGSDRAH